MPYEPPEAMHGPLYYGEEIASGRTLPAYSVSLAGCIGYKTAVGTIVYYGTRQSPQRMEAELMRSINETRERNILAPHRKKRAVVNTSPKATPYRRTHCLACGKHQTVIALTRHHTKPRSVREGTVGVVVRLCRPCHKKIHRIPNRKLLEMTVEQQMEAIRQMSGLDSK